MGAQPALRPRARLEAALRRTPFVLAALLVAASAGIAAAPTPQTAPLAAPVVVGGDGTVNAGWSATAGATGYLVRISGPGADRTHRLPASARGTAFGALRDGARYAVRLTALRGTAAQAAPAVTVAAAAGTPVGVTAVRAVALSGPRIRVTWRGGARMRYLAVTAGSDSRIGDDRFTTGWFRPTAHSAVLTVPKRLRDRIGAGTGQPVFVKVAQTNSLAAHPAMPLVGDDGGRFHLSRTGVWALAGAVDPPKSPTTITVGEWNMQSIGSTATYTPAHQWAARVGEVAAEVESAHPDLLATAELSSGQVAGSTCQNHPSTGSWCTDRTQYMDLAHHLAAAGHPYAIATEDAYPKVIAEMHAGDGAWNGKVTAGSHLFYDPATLQLDAHGYLSPVFDLHVTNWLPKRGDRWLSWARFTVKATGARFLAVAAHFPAGSDAATVAIRADEAAKASAAAVTLADGLPIVFAGDLNADRVRTPDAGSAVLSSLGWFDTAATTHRTGIRYSTDNATNGHDDGGDIGYPAHVSMHPFPTNRIDYILLRGSTRTYSYANVVRTLPGSDALDPAYQGSDHDLQVARIGLP